MKLGEALAQRSDKLKRLAELQARAVANAQTQEGAAVADSPSDLLEQIERIAVETLTLIQRINRTNVSAKLPSGATLADALAEREHYLRLRSPFDTVADAAGAMQQRYMRSEIKIVRTVDPVALRKKADGFSQRHRMLDAAIQEANWTTDLVD
jgi:hypothetical protein